jgi:hypothetical protein
MKKLILSTVIFSFIFYAGFSQSMFVKCEIVGLTPETKLSISLIPFNFDLTPTIKKVTAEKGYFESELILSYNLWHLIRIDSEVFNGVDHPEICVSNDISFFAQPGESIIIEGEIVKYGVKFTIEGNAIGLQQNHFQSKLFETEQVYYKLLDNQKGATDKELHEKLIKQTKEKLDSIALVEIRANPDWLISVISLSGFPPEIIHKEFPNLSQEVRESYFGKYLMELLNSQ